VVDAQESEKLINEGWLFIDVLPTGKVIIHQRSLSVNT